MPSYPEWPEAYFCLALTHAVAGALPTRCGKAALLVGGDGGAKLIQGYTIEQIYL